MKRKRWKKIISIAVCTVFLLHIFSDLGWTMVRAEDADPDTGEEILYEGALDWLNYFSEEDIYTILGRSKQEIAVYLMEIWSHPDLGVDLAVSASSYARMMHPYYAGSMHKMINDEGNLNLTHGDLYDGPFGYRTSYFSVLVDGDTTMAYCIDPTLNTPPTGEYRYYVHEGGGPGTATSAAASILYQYEYHIDEFRAMWEASMNEASVPDSDRNHFDLYDEQSAYFMVHSLVSNCWHAGEIWDAGTSTGAYQITGHQEFKNAFGIYYTKLLLAGHPGNYQVFYVDTGNAYQNIIFTNYKPQGKIQVRKQSNNITIHNANPGQYSLDGAIYGIYGSRADAQSDRNRRAALTIRDGSATSQDLPVGTYYVKEIQASRGYRLNPEIVAVTIEADSTNTVVSKESMQFPKLTLKKTSSDPAITQDHPLYSLENAVYYVYRDEACTQIAEALILNEDGVVVDQRDAVLTTVSDGNSNTLTMIPGTYYVKEIQESTGYILDSSVYPVVLTADDSLTELVECQEIPCMAVPNIHIRKEDSEGIQMISMDVQGNVQPEIGQATLEGAVFEIRYYNNYYSSMGELPDSVNAVWYIETKYNPDTKNYEARLDEEHLSPDYVSSPFLYDSQQNIRIPLGTIVMKEVKSPNGYRCLDEAGVIKHQGGRLSGNAVMMQIKSSDDNHDGHYDHAHMYVDECLSDGTMTAAYQITQDGAPIIVEEEILRGDFNFIKTEQKSGKEMDYVFFRITASTGESHIICTNNGGCYSSKETPHSHNTNALDVFYNSAGEYQGPSDPEMLINQLKEIGDCGLWFYGTSDSSEWDASLMNDQKGALRYDTSYVIEELPCPHNEGKQLTAKPLAILENGACKWLGNITNIDIPEIHTLEWDRASGNHNSPILYDQDSCIMDTISYTNLPEETVFTIKGILMELQEDGTIKGPLLTEDGVLIQSHRTFCTEESRYPNIPYVNGVIDMQYEFSGETFAGKRFVIFEYLYEGEDTAPLTIKDHEVETDHVYCVQGHPILHADAADEGQIGRFLSLHTRALEHTTGSNTCEVTESMKVSDIVDYTALTPGNEYRLYGELVYQELSTGEVKPVYDKNGNAVAAALYFTPETEDGSITIELPEFCGEQFFNDTGEMICSGVVVYETLYWNNRLVAAARDIHDSEETIHFLKREPIPVKLYLHKQEEILQPGVDSGYTIARRAAEGAQFGIFNRKAMTIVNLRKVIPQDTLLYTMKTDEAGYACLEEELLPGEYYCKELIPSGEEYVLDDTEYDFTVQQQEADEEMLCMDLTPDSAILNRYKCQRLELLKVDDDQEPIAGVEFALYRQYGDDYQLIGSYQTDDNGLIVIERVPCGNYYFIETKGVDGYLFDGSTKHVFVVLDENPLGERTAIEQKASEEIDASITGAMESDDQTAYNMHAHGFEYIDGSSVTSGISLVVVNKKLRTTLVPEKQVFPQSPPNSETTTVTESPSTSDLPQEPESPQTGDTSVPFLWWIALIAAGGILAYYLIIRHNRRRR